MSDESDYVASLVRRSRLAFSRFEFATQKTVDDICARMAYACTRSDFVRLVADEAFAATGLGNANDKVRKMEKIRVVYHDMKNKKSVGAIRHDRRNGIVEYAKPIGVIGALIPMTNPEITPVIKTLWALKTRNAIILAPHPRALKVNELIVSKMRDVIRASGLPEDLVVGTGHANLMVSTEVLRQCDLSLATGGADMVKAAYSSGKPAYGVGVGNAYSIVDETVDLREAALKIKASKIFDNASGCSADNGVLAQNAIFGDLVAHLESVGGYLIRDDSVEKRMLQQIMWPTGNGLNREIIARPAVHIAKLAGIEVPENTSFLMVEESGIGENFPFSREKLSPVLTLMRWENFTEAVDMINKITFYSGAGHSCCIHSNDESRIQMLARHVRVARVTVRQPHGLSNSGSWSNGLKNTCTLGCGTWGGGIASENIYYRHLMNITRVSYPLEKTAPSDTELFGATFIKAYAESEHHT